MASDAETTGGVVPPTAVPSDAPWEGPIGGVQVVFGAGRLAELGARARHFGARRVLLICDPHLRAVGHSVAAEESLAAAGLEISTVEEIHPNPTDRDVERTASRCAAFAPDLLVALGGGSTLDSAKGINFLLTNGGRMKDYWGLGKAREPLLPSIGIPTTAGTGSDAQSYAVLSDAESGRKMACGDRGARFRIALLDPDLVATSPRDVRCAAGIDALSHAVESHVSRARTEASAALSRRAWELLDGAFERFLEGTAEPAIAGAMLLGAHLAGAAIEASMLGAAHAAANPLTARCGIVHGLAVGLVLPSVVRFNSAVADRAYGELVAGGGAALATRLETVRAVAGLPGRIRDCGVDRERIPELARLATREWTGGFNPRAVSEEVFAELYENAF